MAETDSPVTHNHTPLAMNPLAEIGAICENIGESFDVVRQTTTFSFPSNKESLNLSTRPLPPVVTSFDIEGLPEGVTVSISCNNPGGASLSYTTRPVTDMLSVDEWVRPRSMAADYIRRLAPDARFLDQLSYDSILLQLNHPLAEPLTVTAHGLNIRRTRGDASWLQFGC
jgi:hypothetical protein